MTDGAIVPAEETRHTLYIPSPGEAKATMDALQEAMQALLTEEDYATIAGKKSRKRTAFTKLRRAFSISVDLIDGAWDDLGDDEFGFSATVRASFPDGRSEIGDGYCDSIEMSGGNIAASRHNVRAKAVTRAKNRATADLLGTGEVSAEEYMEGDYKKRPPKG